MEMNKKKRVVSYRTPRTEWGVFTRTIYDEDEDDDIEKYFIIGYPTGALKEDGTLKALYVEYEYESKETAYLALEEEFLFIDIRDYGKDLIDVEFG